MDSDLDGLKDVIIDTANANPVFKETLLSIPGFDKWFEQFNEEENPLSGYTDQMGHGMAGYSDALVLYMDKIDRKIARGLEKLVKSYPDYDVMFTKNMVVITVNEGDPKHIRDIKDALGLLMPGE